MQGLDPRRHCNDNGNDNDDNDKNDDSENDNDDDHHYHFVTWPPQVCRCPGTGAAPGSIGEYFANLQQDQKSDRSALI